VRFALTSAAKDLRRLRRDPFALLIWLGIPILSLLLMNAVFGSGGATPRGLLLVADEEGNLASKLLTGAFQQGPLANMVVVENVDRQEGRARLERGDGSALLIIPKGLWQALADGRPYQLQLLTNPAQRILPGIIEETLSITLEAAFYLQLAAGDQLRALRGGQPSDQAIAELSVAMNRLGKEAGDFLDPLRMELETHTIEERAVAGGSFAALFLPGMLMWAVMFLTAGQSGDLWKEKAQGALGRAVTAPCRLEAYFAGKLLAVAAVLFGVAIGALLCARWLLRMPAVNLLPAALWVTLTGSALYLLMALVSLYAASERGANLLTNLVLFPLVLAGGSFFPLEIMPASLAAVGRLTPNGWATGQLKTILAGAMEPERLAVAVLGVTLAGALAFALALRRLRRFAR